MRTLMPAFPSQARLRGDLSAGRQCACEVVGRTAVGLNVLPAKTLKKQWQLSVGCDPTRPRTTRWHGSVLIAEFEEDHVNMSEAEF